MVYDAFFTTGLGLPVSSLVVGVLDLFSLESLN